MESAKATVTVELFQEEAFYKRIAIGIESKMGTMEIALKFGKLLRFDKNNGQTNFRVVII